MKLTPAQTGVLNREVHDGGFILLMTTGDDRTAKNLEAKGLGLFVSHGWLYPWRSRDGYLNHFIPNDKGMKLRK